MTLLAPLGLAVAFERKWFARPALRPLACMCIVVLLPTQIARAELQPAQVAVIAARGNRESEALAAYYMKARGIPAANLCVLDLPGEEVCPRDTWTWGIRPEVCKWLDENDPQRRLRCLVTTWGVPLKIGPAAVDAEQRKYQRFLEGERQQRHELLKKLGHQLDAIAVDVVIAGDAPVNDDAKVGDQKSSPLELAQRDLEKHLQAAQARVAKLPDGEKPQAASVLQRCATLAGGARVILQGIEQQLLITPDNAELRSQYDVMRGRAAGLLEMQMLLDQIPLGLQHDALVLAAIERNSGLLGTIQWLDSQLEVVAKNETGASFDSELSLVLFPDDYQLLRWQPNYLSASYAASQWPVAFPTLMVARIDAPTIALAKGLIDSALTTEVQGLQGKVYIDARGLDAPNEKNVQPGSYADYDRALLQTAAGLKQQTTLDVTLNSGPELFQAGACPDAALYCGWYSLAKYVDAFDWQPGAVAYHLASSEASTLRDPGSEVWCKKLLEDGVAATIGPVYEPYLAAFPRPEQFFALLLQGDLTLVECYYRTLPSSSWMMTLIGDPLYRPYKNNKVIKAAASPAAPAAAEGPLEADPTPAAAPASAEDAGPR
jgi:uncharacterized protein (TIGR03790 family)